MTRRIALSGGAALVALALLALSGCSTLNVKTPDGMFLSAESTTIFAPLFICDLTYFSLAIASGVFDFYAEGIAIKKQ
jgi:hypothetical protein